MCSHILFAVTEMLLHNFLRKNQGPSLNIFEETIFTREGNGHCTDNCTQASNLGQPKVMKDNQPKFR